MCNFEPSQKDESRARSVDSSKTYSKLKAFNHTTLSEYMLSGYCEMNSSQYTIKSILW